jgi:hypothetical protein
MPTTRLISKRALENPENLAPWDRDIPLLPKLSDSQKKARAAPPFASGEHCDNKRLLALKIEKTYIPWLKGNTPVDV